MADLAILAGLLMGLVLLSGAFSVVTAWMEAPLWLALPASLLAVLLGIWWWSIPTGAWMLGPVNCFMGLWALVTNLARTESWN